MPLAGAKIRASDIPSSQVISKAANETVTSSATAQNDDDLVVTLSAGKSYRVALWLTVASGGLETGDIQVQWSWGGTAAKTARNAVGPAQAATDSLDTNVELFASSLTVGIGYGIDADRATTIFEELLFEDVTVSGTLQMQWSQRVSQTTGTTLSASSRLFVEEVT